MSQCISFAKQVGYGAAMVSSVALGTAPNRTLGFVHSIFKRCMGEASQGTALLGRAVVFAGEHSKGMCALGLVLFGVLSVLALRSIRPSEIHSPALIRGEYLFCESSITQRELSCAITQLTDEQCHGIKRLFLVNYAGKALPRVISRLTSLTGLKIERCPNLTALPDEVTLFEKLEYLACPDQVLTQEFTEKLLDRRPGCEVVVMGPPPLQAPYINEWGLLRDE